LGAYALSSRNPHANADTLARRPVAALFQPGFTNCVAPAPAPVHPSAMSCLIRPAVAADIPLILQFICDLADYEKLRHEVETTAEQLQRTLFPDAGPPAAHVIIAEDEGRPAGFAVYFFNFSTFLGRPGLYLEDLFVRPEFRGRGLGKALLLHLARLANARGCGRMEWAVLDWNEPAKAFYRSLGAIEMHDWRVNRLTGEALRQYA
jgi:GNAT superfamily N-acetyltransferase